MLEDRTPIIANEHMGDPVPAIGCRGSSPIGVRREKAVSTLLLLLLAVCMMMELQWEDCGREAGRSKAKLRRMLSGTQGCPGWGVPGRLSRGGGSQ